MILNVEKIRKDFPIYKFNSGLVYLDNAASTLKPKVVIDMVDHYYSHLGVNVHRGVYGLSYEATDLYEEARKKVARFLNAGEDEVIFTRGTTTSLNIVADHYLDILKPGDEIITSELEHHSSFLPWLNVSKKTGATLKFVELDDEGKITIENFKKVLSGNTKVVALTYISNVMGHLVPVEEIVKLSKEKGAITVVDAAQAAPHIKIDVKTLGCDFLAFSGHKTLGPTGIGVLYARRELIEALEPTEFGGEMVQEVTKSGATYKQGPFKFEAGTPIISGAIGLGKALEYIESIGLNKIHDHIKRLHDYTISKLEDLEDIEIYNKDSDTGLITFNIKGIHPHDAASIFDKNGVCLRAGHHCAQLITKWLNQIATLRVSFYIYNDYEDCNIFIKSVIETRDYFKKF